MNENNNLTVNETFELAVQSQQKKNFREAESLYNEILKMEPNFIAAHRNLGVLFRSLGEYKKAISSFEKIIEIDPNNIIAHYNLGVMHQENTEYQKAINCYERIIKIDPNNIDALINLGSLLQILRDYKKAINYLAKIIEIDPNYISAHYNLGVVYQKLAENQKAITCYEKVIKIKPNNVDALNNLGVVYQELGDYKKAISYFEKAIETDSDNAVARNNLGVVLEVLGEYQKAKKCYEKAIEIDPNYSASYGNLSDICIQLDDLEKAINLSYKASKLILEKFIFKNQNISLFVLKHAVQQAKYLSSKDYKINGLNEFQKKGDEILNRKENNEDKNNSNKVVLLNEEEINTLLPFYKSDHIYKTKSISGSCINPNKNWQAVEDEYFNSEKQIIYIDDFLSKEALIELREFCLVSRVWNTGYQNKYLGAFSDKGFISPIHLQIAIELKKELPKLFGPHKLAKFWGFKYDTTLGKGINIHADSAIHNLNFWITPDEFNNNKNAGGLKVYDAPAPENWIFEDYNNNSNKIYKYLEDNSANCTKIPYKFNRAVLFNSAYFHETDEIDFKDEYEGRRINMTYLFGSRLIKEI